MATGRLPDPNSSPLTAKGDLYTYSTVPAKLAVGSNGETLVADSSTTTGLRWQGQFMAGKNAFINGDFRINQRAFSSATNPAGTYGFDRWLNYTGDTSGGASAIFSAQTFTLGAAPVAGYEGNNFLRIVTSNQSATASIVFPQQRIEDVRTFAGQTVTISFWAKANSGTPKLHLETAQNFGSGGSPSSETITNFGQVTLSTSWARYSATASLPSLSGKTIGTTAGTSFLSFQPWVSAGTTFNARTNSLGAQNNTFDFWGFQIEAGSVATPFTTATGTLAGELAACQRYCVKVGGKNSATNDPIGVGQAAATTYGVYSIPLPVEMRTTPSLTAITAAASSFAVTNGTDGAITCSAVPAANILSPTLVRVTGTVTTGLTAGQGSIILSNNSANGFLIFTAEL